MFKRDIEYQGLYCLADADTDAYMEAMDVSQAEIPWASQASYAKYTVYFGVVVIFLACAKYVWYTVKDYRYTRGKGLGVVGALVDVITAYSRSLAYKQVPSKLCYWLSLPPSVGSTLMMFVSSVYLFCYCLIPHFWYRSCKGFGSPPLAVRAGVMATALTPFIYVLGGKSNLITLLTGVGYEKLNSFHQYVGVAAFVLSIIHTIPFIYQPLHEGGASALRDAYNGDVYYLSGIPPFVLLAWLCLASKKCIRDKLYEGFLHMHWLCGIAYFGTLIWHINKSLDMQNYMWGALAFWASQVIYRILVKTAFKPTSMFLRSRKGELKKLSGNSYQITVQNIKGLKWKAGQHCYLRFQGKRFLDNHPFSISSIQNEEWLKFIIVPRKGLTKELYNQLDDYAVTTKKVWIDGPYGGVSRDMISFDKVIMAASGSGVTVTIPILSSLCESIREKLELSQTPITKKLDFVWIVRHRNDAMWIMDELKRCVDIAGNYVSINIYVGQPSDNEKVKLESKSTSSDDITQETTEITFDLYNNITIHEYRPNMNKIMGALSGTLLRRNLIISSGSQDLKNSVSLSASYYQQQIFNNDIHSGQVEEVVLHTESFGW